MVHKNEPPLTIPKSFLLINIYYIIQVHTWGEYTSKLLPLDKMTAFSLYSSKWIQSAKQFKIIWEWGNTLAPK